MFADLGNVFLQSNGGIKNLTQSNDAHGQDKAQEETHNGVLRIAGGAGGGGDNSSICHTGGGSVNNGADSLGQNIGNGIGQALCLYRIRTGYRYPEQLGLVHSLCRDHLSEFLISQRSAGIVNDIHQGFSGVENNQIGINQVSGSRQVTGRNAEGSVSQRQVAVIDVEDCRRFILGRYQEEGAGKRKCCAQHGNDDHKPCPAHYRPEQTAGINLLALIFVIISLVHIFLHLSIYSIPLGLYFSVKECHPAI